MKYVIFTGGFLLFLCLVGCSDYRMSQSSPQHWRTDATIYEMNAPTVRPKTLHAMSKTAQKGTDREAAYPVITEKFERDIDESQRPKVTPAP